jgi:hypothetical protein
MVRKEAEGLVLEGYAWFVYPIRPQSGEPHLQDTFCRVQPWSEYQPSIETNGTACLLVDFDRNGCVILTEDPEPPYLPPWYTFMPAEIDEGWTHDDGTWTLTLELVMGTVPFSKPVGSCAIFGGDEVAFWRVHAHKTGARLYLWLCCEGWMGFGPFVLLKLLDDRIEDNTGNEIAIRTPDGWHTPGRFSGCCWHSPMISTSDKHPHPDQGA